MPASPSERAGRSRTGENRSEAWSFDAVARRVPFLAALSAAELDRVRPCAVLRRLGPGQKVWHEDDAPGEFVFVVEGHVKLARAADSGREVILHTCGVGTLLCGSAVGTGGRYCCGAATLEATTLVAVPRCALLDLVDRNPPAARAFLDEAARREVALTSRIEELSAGHVERRVAALLVRLLEQAGLVEDGGVRIPLTFSRQDLADLCGTTVETVIRTMSRLRRGGIVQTVEGGFLVRDAERLEALARGRG
jgi:CRP-like cAMP-binding protein